MPEDKILEREIELKNRKWPFRALLVLVIVQLIALFWIFNLITIRPRISPETTRETGPLTADGKRVDYFAVVERMSYPPEIASDENGYRLFVQSLGNFERPPLEREAWEHRCEKLGLDPDLQPLLKYTHITDFTKDNYANDPRNIENAVFDEKFSPEVREIVCTWVEENDAALDLLGVALEKPLFFKPLRKFDENETIFLFSDLESCDTWRGLGRSLFIRSRFRLDFGDLEGTVDDAIALLRLGRMMMRKGGGLDVLTGIALELMAYSLPISDFSRGKIDLAVLRRFEEVIENLPELPDLKDFMEREHLETLSLVQELARKRADFKEKRSEFEHHNNMIATHTKYPFDYNVMMRFANARYDAYRDTENFENPQKFGHDLSNVEKARLFLDRTWRSKFFVDSFCQYDEMDAGIRRELGRLDCLRNMKKLGIALLRYHEEKGTLPPGYTLEETGKPLHSWRTLLLPYLGQEELYSKIRLDEPWDSEHNRQFHEIDIPVFRCSGCSLKAGETLYAVAFGDGSPFGPGVGKNLDGYTESPLLVLELEQPVNWMAPKAEIAFETGTDQAEPLKWIKKPGFLHSSTCNTLRADGAVKIMSKTMRAE